MKQTLFCKMKYSEGTFKPASKEDEIKLNLYMKQFKDNSDFDLILSLSDAAKTYPQLQRIHAMIRELSNYTGMPFEDMKNYIKMKAGLFNYESKDSTLQDSVKSFKECTKKELDTAIIIAEEIAATMDLALSV
jgi:hypothetical protein